MELKKRLPESETEIMLTVWELGGSVTADEIMARMQKDWGKTTLLNLLTRLVAREFLSCRKEGRINVYTPLVAREEYLRWESDSFLRRFHAGSLKKLVASLYDGNSVTKEDLEELRRFIDEAK